MIRHNEQQLRGFTLIELLITLAMPVFYSQQQCLPLLTSSAIITNQLS
ncbi:prepilin-type N-terminal cleavage/methylation domain-containing protein [sulfur-oxidizing endosymbiont of Gigantopelta aegis]|nr:prepilin-type N-terminal cleavage/methylation domain-containing protein [sulfur-oxidizing endosymbiont of Gigantopelta aegis]